MNPPSTKLYSIYILQCAHGTYYVGKTTNVVRRLKQHSDGVKKVEWLNVHKLVDIVELHTEKTADYEDFYTEKYMFKYGVDNVRGGSYVTVKLPDFQMKALELKRRGVTDSCFKCGGQHFANVCKITPSKEDEEKILDVVKVLNGCCGRNYIANVLVDEEVKPKHENLSMRGIGKDKMKGEWVGMIDGMIASGKLRIIQKGVYPMVALGLEFQQPKQPRRNSKKRILPQSPSPTQPQPPSPPTPPTQPPTPPQPPSPPTTTIFDTITKFFGY